MFDTSKALRRFGATAVFVLALGSTTALADPLGFAAPSNPFGTIFEQMLGGGDGGMNNDTTSYAARRDA